MSTATARRHAAPGRPRWRWPRRQAAAAAQMPVNPDLTAARPPGSGWITGIGPDTTWHRYEPGTDASPYGPASLTTLSGAPAFAPADPDLLGRLADGLRGMDDDTAAQDYREARSFLETVPFEAVPDAAPAPPEFPVYVPSFLADWRELPHFRATCRVRGWCGLAMARGGGGAGRGRGRGARGRGE